MRAGQLRHKLEIHAPGDLLRTPGATPQKTGGAEATRRASVETLEGEEFEQAKTIDARASVKVKIRYFDGLTPRHWFVHGDRTLHIAKILPDKRDNVHQVCWCYEDL